MTLARWLARKAVKTRWHAQGLRVQTIEPSELGRVARVYLDQHRDDLLRQACATLERFARKSKARKTGACANVINETER